MKSGEGDGNSIDQGYDEVGRGESSPSEIRPGGSPQNGHTESSLFSIVETLPSQTAILDETGEIIYTNTAWREFAAENGHEESPGMVGVDYLSVCEDSESDSARHASEGLRALLDGERREFTIEYPCHSPTEKRWFELQATRFQANGDTYLLLVHVEITDRKLAITQINQLLDTLNTTIQDLLAVDSEQAVADITARTLTSLFESVVGVVYYYDESNHALEPRAKTRAAATVTEEWPTISDTDSIIWQTFATQTPERVQTDSTNPATPITGDFYLPIGSHGVILLSSNRETDCQEREVEILTALAASVETVLDRLRARQTQSNHDRVVEKKEDHMQRLQSLLQLVCDLTQETITGMTQRTVEEAVCETLVSADLFEVAWIGQVDEQTDALVARTWAAAGERHPEGVLPDGTADETHPAMHVLETGVMDTCRNFTAGDVSYWESKALEYGFHACCAVPLVYRGWTHGVLTLYADDETAFEGPIKEVLEELVGPLIAHALSAQNRKRELMSNQTTELTLSLSNNCLPSIALSRQLDCTLRVQRVVPRSEQPVVISYAVEGAAPKRAVSVARDLRGVEDARVVDDDSIQLTQSICLSELLAEYGCQLRTFESDETGARATISIPGVVDSNQVVAIIEESYPGTELLAKRGDRTVSDSRSPETLLDEALTDRQREVLEAAFDAGYVAQPRKASGQQIATQLGITQPTFNQHFWTGLQRLLNLLLADD